MDWREELGTGLGWKLSLVTGSVPVFMVIYTCTGGSTCIDQCVMRILLPLSVSLLWRYLEDGVHCVIEQGGHAQNKSAEA